MTSININHKEETITTENDDDLKIGVNGSITVGTGDNTNPVTHPGAIRSKDSDLSISKDGVWKKILTEDDFGIDTVETDFIQDGAITDSKLNPSLGVLRSSNNLSDVQNSSTALSNLNGVPTTRQVNTGTGLLGGGNLSGNLTISANIATTPEAIAGTNNTKLMTPLRTKEAIDNILMTYDAFPVGAVVAFAANDVPSGWLICNGALILRATYPNLFDYIGTTYGSTSSANFRLPDLRGEFIRGFDAGRGVDSGRVFGSFQSYATGPHNHIGSSSGLTLQEQSGAANAGIGASDIRGVYNTSRSGYSPLNVTGESETRPRNIAMIYCIKAFDSAVNPGMIDISELANDVAILETRIDAMKSLKIGNPQSYLANTVYFAPDGGFVKIYLYVNNFSISVLSDSNSNPTTFRDGYLATGASGSLTVPIPAGHYWKASYTSSASFWYPFV